MVEILWSFILQDPEASSKGEDDRCKLLVANRRCVFINIYYSALLETVFLALCLF